MGAAGVRNVVVLVLPGPKRTRPTWTIMEPTTSRRARRWLRRHLSEDEHETARTLAEDLDGDLQGVKDMGKILSR